MSKSQRTKGAVAEREFAGLLNERLDVDCARNLEQTRNGGADLLGVGPWAIEVKRHERLAIEQWWRQACAQACDAYPALAYRQSRRPWSIIVPLSALIVDGGEECRVTLDLEGFCLLTKRLMEAS
jgi:hypothetical protein